MVTFPKYESYKDSGVEWLGEIPSSWSIKPGRAYLKPQKVKNIGNKVKTVLSLSYGKIVIKPEEKLHGLVPESFETYQIAEPGNIIIRATDLQNDHTSLRIGLVKDRGIITSAYLCLAPSEKMDLRFAYYVLHIYDLLKVYYGMGSGLRQNLDYTDFKYLPLPIPSREEQKRIVKFLDRKTSEIDQAIAQKQRLIELLQEQKAILINQAVTKGLDPNVPMCDRGVEWLGAIPTHWGNIRLKTLMKKMDQGWSPQCFAYQADIEQWGVLKVGCVNGYKFNPLENKVLPPDLKPDEQLEIQHEDILISRANTIDLVGSAACVLYPRKKLMLCDKLYRIRANKNKVIPEYFVLLLQTKIARQQIEIGANGASPSMQNIGQDVIKNLYVPIPPISEQRQILSLITDFVSQQEETKTSILKEIQLLVELKHSLISNSVTGKIKV